MRGLEVGDTGGPDPAVGPQLLQGAPGVGVEVAGGGGPVDEVEVDVVEAELGEAGVEGGERGVVPLVSVPELRRDEQFLAGEPDSASARPTPASLP